MTNDLEQRVNELILYLSQMIEFKKTFIYTPEDVIELLKDQQAEIQRLKAGQLRLRPMEELKERPGKDVLCLDDASYAYKKKFVVASYCSCEQRVRNEFTILENPIGWIDLSELPTEVME